jgi:hypothetical protein
VSEQKTHDAFRSVSRCPVVEVCLKDGNTQHPCHDIVHYQVTERGVTSPEDFQVPEPWVGQIDIAPILFVASNPSIGKDDHSGGSTPDDILWDAHHLAFGGGSRRYIVDGTKTTSTDGTVLKNVAYWSSVRARAQELIPDREVVPGVDYALTEIVHCKTEHEFGVAAAAQTCADLHLDGILSVAAARLVVVMGVVARHALLPEFAEPFGIVQKTLGERQRTLVILPHPNKRGGSKSFHGNYDSNALSSLRACLLG